VEIDIFGVVDIM